MRKILGTLIVLACLGIISPALTTAADVNAFVGSWKLNVAKSKYHPGPAPKSLTRTYAKSAQGLNLTYTGADAEGNPTNGSHIINLDGKDYPEADAPDYNSSSAEVIDPSKFVVKQKMNGKIVATLTYVVAANGKQMTLSKQGVDANGVAFDIVAVYDRL